MAAASNSFQTAAAGLDAKANGMVQAFAAAFGTPPLCAFASSPPSTRAAKVRRRNELNDGGGFHTVKQLCTCSVTVHSTIWTELSVCCLLYYCTRSRNRKVSCVYSCMCMHTSSTLRVYFLTTNQYTLALRSLSKTVEPPIPANYTGGLCDLGTELVRLSLMISNWYSFFGVYFPGLSRVLFPNLACALPSIVDRPLSTSPLTP